MAVSPAVAGILWMLVAMSCIAIVDAFAKVLASDLHGSQIAWGYFFAIFLNLLIYARFRGHRLRSLARSRKPLLQIGRAACLVLSLTALFVSLRYLPLAEATTISFTSPLFVAALAGPLLGEKVGWRRWSAIVAGMIGAVIVVRPGSELFSWASILPLVGAFWFALFQIATRKLGPVDNPLVTLAYTSGGGFLLISAVIPFVWSPASLEQWALLLGLGTIGVVAHLSMIRALSLGDASALAPLNYVRIVWALALGLILFGQFPDAVALLGGAIIVASGLYVFWREARRPPA